MRRRRRRRRGMKWDRVVARGRKRERGIWRMGGADAPALLVMLAVAGLPVCDRRGRRTSQLSSTICSPHVVLTLPCPPLPPPQALILLLFIRISPPSTFPIQSSLLSVACPPSAAPSSIPMGSSRWAVYLWPGGSVQSWILRAKAPLPAWCSCSRLPSCPDQPPHLFLLPRSLLRHHTARHSRPPPRHTLTHTQKEPRCDEQRHKIQTQAMCHRHTHTHTHTAEV